MKKILKAHTVVALAVVFALASCVGNDKPYKKRSIGSTSEILVVTQNAEQWDGRIGDSIRAFFGQFQYGLPQAEPMYKMIHINVARFNNMFETYRNIIIVENDGSVNTPVIESGEDRWAKPQRCFRIVAPDEDSWLMAFDTKKDFILDEFNKMERERLMDVFRPSTDKKIYELLGEEYGIAMNIPEGYYVAKNEEGFMWIRKSLERMETGFFIYEQPYVTETDLDPRRIVQMRDLVLCQNVPGPLEGTYMSTDREFVVPRAQILNDFAGLDYAVEIRGMWDVKNDWMAGPFVSYTVPTPEADKLITVEGYIYQPNKEKRDLLRQAEAILHSFKFVRPATEEAKNETEQ